MAESERAELVAHAELGDHLTGDGRRPVDVVLGAGRRVLEDELFGAAAAEQHRQLVDQLVAGDEELVFGREGEGVAERAASRDDRDLVHRVGVGQRVRDEGMATLVVGDDLPLPVGDDAAAPFGAGHHPLGGLLELGEADELQAVAGREQRRFVEEVGEVGAGEAGGSTGDQRQVDSRGRGASRSAWTARIALRPARSGRSTTIWRSKRPGRSSAGSRMSGRFVDASRMTPLRWSKPSISTRSWLRVCSRSSWPPPTPAPRWRPTASISSTKTIAGRGGLGLLEEVPDPGCADADEHLDEIGAADRKERHPGRAGDGAGQQGLAGAGRPVEEDPLRDLGAHRTEPGRVFEELLDLAQLGDGLVEAGDVGEGDRRLVLGERLGSGPPEARDPAAAALDLAQQEEDDAEDEDERQDRDERPDPGAALLAIDVEPTDVRRDDLLGDRVGVSGGEAHRVGGAVGEGPLEDVVLVEQRRLPHLPVGQSVPELGQGQVGACGPAGQEVERGEAGDHCDDEERQEGAAKLAQSPPRLRGIRPQVFMDLRDVPVPLVDVEAVPDDERRRDPKPDIAQIQVDLLQALFEEERAHPEGAGGPGGEVLAQVLQGQPGIHDVLDDQDVTAGQVQVEVLLDPHDTAGSGRGPVRGDRHEVELDREVDGAGEVAHEHAGALEDPDEQRGPVGVVGRDLLAERGDPSLQLVLADHDPAEVGVPADSGRNGLAHGRTVPRSTSRRP